MISLMPQMSRSKTGRAALAALCVATLMSCSRTETTTPTAAPITSEGRGAPVNPAIPWEMWRNAEDIEAIPPREIKGYPEQNWLVGPLDGPATRSEEHTSELQSLRHLVCRLLLEKKKRQK